MKESNELFELSKQVYEATGWRCTTNYNRGGRADQIYGSPDYTSDYLLEKLPPALWVEVSGEGQQVALLALNMQGNGEAIAVYEIPYDKEFRGSYSSRADTPLEALLKLTLRLHEEKIL